MNIDHSDLNSSSGGIPFLGDSRCVSICLRSLRWPHIVDYFVLFCKYVCIKFWHRNKNNYKQYAISNIKTLFILVRMAPISRLPKPRGMNAFLHENSTLRCPSRIFWEKSSIFGSVADLYGQLVVLEDWHSWRGICPSCQMILVWSLLSLGSLGSPD